MRNLHSNYQDYDNNGHYDTSKYRYRLPSSMSTMSGTMYQNIQLRNGTLQPITLSHGPRKYSSSSVSDVLHHHHHHHQYQSQSQPQQQHQHHHHHQHNMWQEMLQLQTSTNPCLDNKPSSSIYSSSTRSKKACTIGLAVLSFIFLIIILIIAGLALYMGISTATTSSSSSLSSNSGLISFSCSIKVLKGDRLIGDGLEEKRQRYKRQIELIYKNSIIGQSFISCFIDRFGKDGHTIFFRLIFNRFKLMENSINVEKTLRDIFLSDITNSRKSSFRNIKFDPKSLLIVKQQIQSEKDNKDNKNLAAHLLTNSTTNKKFTQQQMHRTNKLFINQTNEIQKGLKVNVNVNETAIKHQQKKKNGQVEVEEVEKDEELINNKSNTDKAVHGSFTITKTDADIVERKSPNDNGKLSSNYKVSIKKVLENPKITTGVNLSISTQVPSLLKMLISSTTSVVPTITSPTVQTSTESTTTTTTRTTTQLSIISSTKSTVYDIEPWIPIFPNNKKIPYTDSDIYQTPSSSSSTSIIFPWLNHKIVDTSDSRKEIDEDMNLGQGHVEVIDDDVDELLINQQSEQQQIPLVTLLPVRSNSGIQSLTFKENSSNGSSSSSSRQWKDSKGFFENRSFLSNKNKENDHQIMGILNFKNDEYNIMNSTSLIVKS